VARHYPGREDRFTFLPGPELDIASTDIRARVAAGRSIRDLAPEPVVDYIEAHRLYRAGPA
jgi:nicotinate-nucleotide adenylyltransferase